MKIKRSDFSPQSLKQENPSSKHFENLKARIKPPNEVPDHTKLISDIRGAGLPKNELEILKGHAIEQQNFLLRNAIDEQIRNPPDDEFIPQMLKKPKGSTSMAKLGEKGQLLWSEKPSDDVLGFKKVLEKLNQQGFSNLTFGELRQLQDELINQKSVSEGSKLAEWKRQTFGTHFFRRLFKLPAEGKNAYSAKEYREGKKSEKELFNSLSQSISHLAKAPERLVHELMKENKNNSEQVAKALLQKATDAAYEGDTENFKLSLGSLAFLSESKDEETKRSALDALSKAQKLPVMEKGGVPRTPSEIVVHVGSELAGIDTRNLSEMQKKVIEELRTEVKSAFMAHSLNVLQTRELLKSIVKKLDESGLESVKTTIEELLGQLPEKGEDIPMTRYHDNPYARVYDSKLIDHLVKDTPPGVNEAMQKSGKFLADWLSDEQKVPKKISEQAAMELQKYLKEGDPRFWFNKVPELEKLKNAQTPEEAQKALIAFLESSKKSGYESIAIPYVAVKLSVILRTLAEQETESKMMWQFINQKGMVNEEDKLEIHKEVKKHQYDYAPWMKDADENYNFVVMPQASREKKVKAIEPSKVAGITLPHQPAVVSEEWMEPSFRPVTENRPLIEKHQRTESMNTALEQGIPFASGVSGSTNVMLNFLNYANNEGNKNINAKDFMLGNTMFLVYDGGHSIHEALWVANQLEPKLKLGVAKGTNEPNKFVSNLEDYINSNDSLTREKLQSASDQAWTDTTEYFKEYSIHSRNAKTK